MKGDATEYRVNRVQKEYNKNLLNGFIRYRKVKGMNGIVDSNEPTTVTFAITS